MREKESIGFLLQVNLASIISKDSNQRYQSELYRNVDYGIFSKDLTKLYLLIELNDSTHKSKKYMFSS